MFYYSKDSPHTLTLNMVFNGSHAVLKEQIRTILNESATNFRIGSIDTLYIGQKVVSFDEHQTMAINMSDYETTTMAYTTPAPGNCGFCLLTFSVGTCT